MTNRAASLLKVLNALGLTGVVLTRRVYAPPRIDCGAFPGLMDPTGIVFSLAYIAAQMVTALCFLPARIAMGVAWLVVRLHAIVLDVLVGPVGCSGFNCGVLGQVFWNTSMVFVVALAAALGLYALFTIARFMFTANVTTPQRLVWVTLLALVLAGSGPQVARSYDVLRESAGRYAFQTINTLVLASGLSIPGAPGGVNINCNFSGYADGSGSNLCSGYRFAQAFLFYQDDTELFSQSTPQGFRDRFFRPMSEPEGEVSISTVSSYTCNEFAEGVSLLTNMGGGMARAFQGYPVAYLAIIEETIWLMLSFAALALFVALGISVILAVFSHFGQPLNVVLNAAIQLIIASVVAGLLMGLFMALILLCRFNDILFTSACFLAAWVYSQVVLKQVVELVVQTTQSMAATAASVTGGMTISGATQNIKENTPPEREGLLSPVMQPIRDAGNWLNDRQKGAEAGQFAGAGGVMLGGLLGQQAFRRAQTGAGRGASMGMMAGGPEGAMAGAGLGAVVSVVGGDEAGDVMRQVPVIINQAGSVSGMLGGKKAKGEKEEAPSDGEKAAPSGSEKAAPSGGEKAAPSGNEKAAPVGGESGSANEKNRRDKARTSGSPVFVPPLTADEYRREREKDREAWLALARQAYQSATPSQAWSEASHSGYGGQVNRAVNTAREYGLSEAAFVNILQAASQGERGKGKAVEITLQQAGAPIDDLAARAFVRQVTPLAMWAGSARGSESAPAFVSATPVSYREESNRAGSEPPEVNRAGGAPLSSTPPVTNRAGSEPPVSARGVAANRAGAAPLGGLPPEVNRAGGAPLSSTPPVTNRAGSESPVSAPTEVSQAGREAPAGAAPTTNRAGAAPLATPPPEVSRAGSEPPAGAASVVANRAGGAPLSSPPPAMKGAEDEPLAAPPPAMNKVEGAPPPPASAAASKKNPAVVSAPPVNRDEKKG